jgi:ribonucleotide monophosphatase NagD (HAD superfamily)
MIMIGDRPNTDIELGYNSGIDTCLVLTGVVKNEDDIYSWAKQKDSYIPTWVI